MKKKIFFPIVTIFMTFSLHANIRLPNILSNNMVLQQQSSTRLWGWANPSEKIKITTSWDNQTKEITTDENANWQVNIQTPKAGGPYHIIFQGQNKIVLENILIGEVWLCAGQSNMEWSFNKGIKSIKEEFSGLNKLKIRLLQISKSTSQTVQDNANGNWTVCDSITLKSFSAVGYYFGKYLNKDLNVPIGLISSNWGGTPAEVWTPSDVVENNPTLKSAATKNKFNPSRPVTPGSAYNTMIAPLHNYNIAGTIWYQGESNREAPLTYAELMRTMITSWRKAWGRDFPFYYVQIAPFKYDHYNVGALVREAQTKNLSIPKTGMTVISDLVTDTLNIHPSNKKDVGLRLANLALADTYGLRKGAVKSPIFKSFTITDSHILINFDNAENGLKLKGEPKEIFIAGSDRIFYPASVKVKGNKIIVWSKQIKLPAAVRYQFSNAAIGNLYSSNGLPVAPFRTDTWEVDTSKITQ